MTITVKNTRDGLIVPPSVRRKAGIKTGDLVEFKVSGGVITILPKVTGASDEYTPEQRHLIDARLAESEEDLGKGRTFGPFNTAEEMIASMKRELKKRALARKTMRLRNFCIGLALLFVSAGLHAADDPNADPFLGTWKYNYAKSTHDEESATQMTRRHELAGDGMKFTRDAIDAHGKPSHSEYTIKFDGKDYFANGGSSGPAQSYKRIDRSTIECHVKFDAEHSLKQVMVMAKDGKSYVLTETGQYANGKVSNHFSVFEKQ